MSRSIFISIYPHVILFIGEVGEPFWIKNPNDVTNKKVWRNPDEHFITEITKSLITSPDLKQFWDMLSIIIKYPAIAALCKLEEIRSHEKIGLMLSKPENKLLWINGYSEILPKTITNIIIDKNLIMQSPPSVDFNMSY